MNFKIVAWLIGMWIVGGFIYTFLGMQISITKRCALKLYSMVCNDTDYWYAEACHKYFKKVIRTNTIIIFVVWLLVLQFIPLIGAIGFSVGYLLKWLSTRNVTGISNTNLEESIAIFLRFAKPGLEAEFEERLSVAVYKLQSDGIFRI